MSDVDQKLRELLHELAASFYYEGSSKEWFEEEVPEWSDKFKEIFKEKS